MNLGTLVLLIILAFVIYLGVTGRLSNISDLWNSVKGSAK